MLTKIHDGRHQHGRIVIGTPKHAIAGSAQQLTNLAGLVIMVDIQDGAIALTGRRLTTDGAQPILAFS